MKNKNLNILIVEDEVIACEYLINILESFDYTNIFSASTMQEALEIVKTNRIDLVFMDINIDGFIDGIECAIILNKEYFLPIIFTTAYEDENTITEASETNIFGYLIKPFEKSEVNVALIIALKRMKNLKKKLPTNNQKDIIDLGKNQKFNFITNTFFINNIPVNLTKKETNILYLLCKNINQNISYEALIEYVWQSKDVANSTIRDTMSRLKKKAPNLNIETVINLGYILRSHI